MHILVIQPSVPSNLENNLSSVTMSTSCLFLTQVVKCTILSSIQEITPSNPSMLARMCLDLHSKSLENPKAMLPRSNVLVPVSTNPILDTLHPSRLTAPKLEKDCPMYRPKDLRVGVLCINMMKSITHESSLV